jgi:predicted HTH domain antitoxin
MDMRTLQIPSPDDLPEALGETPEEFERQLKFLVAAKLYEFGRLSSERAAEVAEMDREEREKRWACNYISLIRYSSLFACQKST